MQQNNQNNTPLQWLAVVVVGIFVVLVWVRVFTVYTGHTAPQISLSPTVTPTVPPPPSQPNDPPPSQPNDLK
ncbi:MAG: hypothetical protein HC911_18165 [Chloroflexaceae bacterium]|nr:hypothetical protein [Chloroflexaceae bacterium]